MFYCSFYLFPYRIKITYTNHNKLPNNNANANNKQQNKPSQISYTITTETVETKKKT